MPWRHSFIRFLASGAFNTVATYIVYVALLNILTYRWSYTISYLSGIGLAYVLSRYFVFGHSGGRYGFAWLVLIYCIQYAVGILLVHVWVEFFNGPPLFAPAFAIAMSLPLTYFLSRRVFSGGENATRDRPLK